MEEPLTLLPSSFVSTVPLANLSNAKVQEQEQVREGKIEDSEVPSHRYFSNKKHVRYISGVKKLISDYESIEQAAEKRKLTVMKIEQLIAEGNKGWSYIDGAS